MTKHPKPQHAAPDFDDQVAEVLAAANGDVPPAVNPDSGVPEDAVSTEASEGEKGESPGESAEASVTPTPPARSPRNSDLSIVVRTVSERQRSVCSLERGPHVLEEFSVMGKVPEGAEDILAAFASITALHLAQYAHQHDVDVIRVFNVDAGKLLAQKLREADFFVIEPEV